MLQISEPGQSPAPHRKRFAVGIDLGTTFSLVAAIRHGVPECLPDTAGRVLLPSVVRYNANTSVGWGALEGHGGTLVSSVKRLMGKSLAETNTSDLAYPVRGDASGAVIDTPLGNKHPVEVSAQILRQLRERAEQSFGEELCGAVVTVPAYFDDAQRQATKDAAELAGLNVLRLLNEPTAAAIAYGLDNAAEGVYAFYDLGGGTFDISLLRMTKGVFEVIATGGDTHLGGDDFDARVARWLVGDEAFAALDDERKRALLAQARLAKEQLFEHDHVLLRFEADQAKTLTRAAFATLTQDLVERTLKTVGQTLRSASLTPAEVQGVVLVGGSTRLLAVREAVQRYFGVAPLCNLDPDQVVALGAARQAHLLAGHRGEQDWLLVDVVPLSLGLETAGGIVERLIERNSSIPCMRAQDFTTFKDGQAAMSIHVVQGERELVSDCRSLARFELRGLPPLPAGAVRVRVTFRVDADGILAVSAREEVTGKEVSISVKPSYGLSEDEVREMLRRSYESAGQDMQERALREARVEAERLLLAVESALKLDAALLSDTELQEIESRREALRVAAQGADTRAIDAAHKYLAQATEHFAAERMNRDIRAALAGKSLDAL